MPDSPTIFAFAGVLLTVIVNLVLGIIKSRNDKRTAEDDDEGAFQDRLLKRIDAQEIKIATQEKRIDTLEQMVDELRKLNRQTIDEKYLLERKIHDLEHTNVALERNNRKLQEINDLLTIEIKHLRTRYEGGSDATTVSPNPAQS